MSDFEQLQADATRLLADNARLRAALGMVAQIVHGSTRVTSRIAADALKGADPRDVDTVEASADGTWGALLDQRDRLLKRVKELEGTTGYEVAAEWRDKCNVAETRVAELEAALKPFAARYHQWQQFWAVSPDAASSAELPVVPLDDHRRAAELLAAPKGVTS